VGVTATTARRPARVGGRPAKGKRARWSPLRTAIVLLVAATYLYPFLFMVATALKPEDQYLDSPAGWPTSLTLDHVSYAWDASNLGQALRNSAIAVSIGVVICCLMCSAAAFWFIRNKSRLSRILLGSFGSLWIVPQVVWLVPFFVILSTLNLTDNLVVLGVVYGTVFAPSFIWLLWAYFLQGIPDDVVEAAVVDGATLWQQYLRIVLPLSLPALGAVAALTFVYAWGDLLLAVVLLQDPAKFTVVPSAATLVGRFDAAIQATTAAALITILPSLAVFLVAQRAIVKGITGGFSK
jgi:raffinose/stachyose/melibiose transport system permease protein